MPLGTEELEEKRSELIEIDNRRYLRYAFWVLPLVSGRIAVLTPRRDLFKVVDNWDEAMRVGPLAEAAQLAPRLIEEPLTGSKFNIDLDLDL